MEVFIWGTGKLAKDCMIDLLPEVEIIGFVESLPQKKEFCGHIVISGRELMDRTYDYIILANSHEQDILKEFALDVRKIVYYRLAVEMDSCGKIQFRRKNADMLGAVLFQSQIKLEIVESARKIMPYISVESEDLKFLFNRNDNLIANDILGYGKTYSREEMQFLYNIAPKIEQGYFFDIGANVGTTSIYFKKKIFSQLKYVAFEPLKENYNVLKANCILNDCEDIQTVNAGMSNVVQQKKMFVLNGAFGSTMVSDRPDASELCNFTTLDKYVQENNVSAKDIAYFWVDVQNHELEVVEGGLKTLRTSPGSLFIEFNIANYRKEQGKVERFLKLLKQIYSTFICYEQYEKGKNDVRSVQDLMLLPEELDLRFCNILLMK